MTCNHLGQTIGVVNCGCRGDIDTNIHRCESFDTATAFCVVIGPGEQTKEVVKLDGMRETLTFAACNRCQFNTAKRRTKKPEPNEQPAAAANRWERYATPQQIEAKKRRFNASP